MNRQPFSRPVRVEIMRRASVNGLPTCERVEDGVRCACVKGLEIHHVRMDATVADADKAARKLTAEDGELLCGLHHDVETKMQVSDLAKALRVEAAHLNAKAPPAKPIASRGFTKVSKTKAPLRIAAGVPEIMRRFGQ